MKITRLAYQKQNPNRVNVYVDGEFAAGLETNDAVRLGLYRGQEIDQTRLQKIATESESGKLLNAALQFLSFRPRGEAEMREYLARKKRTITKTTSKKENTGNQIVDNRCGVKDRKIENGKWGQEIDFVIEKLRRIGQINDLAFARWFIEQRNTFRPKGKRSLKYELLRKGVNREIVAQVLEETTGEKDELELALKAAQKIARGPWPAEQSREQQKKIRAKLVRFLASRGFGWETIEAVLPEILPEMI